MKHKGIFLTFEGGDGAGKTTLMQNLHQYLLQEAEVVIETRACGGTPVGEQIRHLLLHGKTNLCGKSELFLFLADRVEHVKQVIRPALAEGKIVLCDRFNDSTVAYQGLARGLDSSFVRSLCAFATENLEPDLTFYLDIEPEFGLARAHKRSGAKDRMESETLDFHQRIRAAFHEMALKEPARIKILDATLSQEHLLQQARDYLYDLFLSHR